MLRQSAVCRGDRFEAERRERWGGDDRRGHRRGGAVPAARETWRRRPRTVIGERGRGRLRIFLFRRVLRLCLGAGGKVLIHLRAFVQLLLYLECVLERVFGADEFAGEEAVRGLEYVERDLERFVLVLFLPQRVVEHLFQVVGNFFLCRCRLQFQFELGVVRGGMAEASLCGAETGGLLFVTLDAVGQFFAKRRGLRLGGRELALEHVPLEL